MGFLSSLGGGPSITAPTVDGSTTFGQQNDFGSALAQSQANALGGNAGNNAIGAQQAGLANTLGQEIQGGGPNLAQTQLQDATDRNIAQTAGQVGSIQGINPALQAQIISQQGGAARQALGNQSAQLRQQEQLAAQQQQAQVLGEERGQGLQQQQADTSLLGTAGGLQQGQTGQNAQVAETNAGNNLAAQGLQEQQYQANLAQAGKLEGNIAAGVSGGLGKGATAAHGGTIGDYRGGGEVPGHAAVAGDSPKNDTVPATLSPEEEVLPRSITMAPNAPELAADFVRELQAHHMHQDGHMQGHGFAHIKALEAELAAAKQGAGVH